MADAKRKEVRRFFKQLPEQTVDQIVEQGIRNDLASAGKVPFASREEFAASHNPDQLTLLLIKKRANRINRIYGFDFIGSNTWERRLTPQLSPSANAFTTHPRSHSGGTPVRRLTRYRIL